MLILAAILAIFVYGMIAAMLDTILPDLAAHFELTHKQNGTIAFYQAIGLIIASVSAGPLIDNEGKKVGMVLGLALITLALVLLPRSSGFASIATYLLLLGIGGGIIVTAANALASDVTPERRGTTLNLLNLFFGLGGLATPFISAITARAIDRADGAIRDVTVARPGVHRLPSTRGGTLVALRPFARTRLCRLVTFIRAGPGAGSRRPWS